MKQTSVEHIGRSQLIPSVGQTERWITTGEPTEQHFRHYFEGHPVAVKQWLPGPGQVALPNMRVLEIGPGPRLNQWTYATAGAAAYGLRKLEFLTIGDDSRDTYVELLTMVAHYAIDHRLGLGHTIPIGQPLLEGSTLEHVYLSLPYLFGPALEIIQLPDGEHQVLWLFPITKPEKVVLLESGLDALEERLESQNVEYWSPFRNSVV